MNHAFVIDASVALKWQFRVVLAQMLDTELWTDDRRLRNAVGSVAPWIRWIGDYPLT